MPGEDKNFGGSLVLDFRKWWRHVKTIYKITQFFRDGLGIRENEILKFVIPDLLFFPFVSEPGERPPFTTPYF